MLFFCGYDLRWSSANQIFQRHQDLWWSITAFHQRSCEVEGPWVKPHDFRVHWGHWAPSVQILTTCPDDEVRKQFEDGTLSLRGSTGRERSQQFSKKLLATSKQRFHASSLHGLFVGYVILVMLVQPKLTQVIPTQTINTPNRQWQMHTFCCLGYALLHQCKRWRSRRWWSP